MAVFPEELNRIDTDDSSITALEQYIRYMCERIEFSIQNVTKTVSNAGISNAEVVIMLASLENSVASIQSIVNGHTGRLSSIDGSIVDITSRLSTIEGKLTTIEGNITSINNSISALDTRVTALEGKESNV